MFQHSLLVTSFLCFTPSVFLIYQFVSLFCWLISLESHFLFRLGASPSSSLVAQSWLADRLISKFSSKEPSNCSFFLDFNIWVFHKQSASILWTRVGKGICRILDLNETSMLGLLVQEVGTPSPVGCVCILLCYSN